MVRIVAVALAGCLVSGLLLLTFCDRRKDGRTESPILLPDTAYRVGWDFGGVQGSFKAGVARLVAIRVTNGGSSTWPSAHSTKSSPPGAYCVRLGYRWWDANRETVLVDYSARIELPVALPPGETVALIFEITPPPAAGDYQLQFDLVYELVSWYETKGAARGFVKVTVQP